MRKSHLKLVTPATVKRTVTPRRARNGDLRTREYLTETELQRLMEAAKGNRNGQRDARYVTRPFGLISLRNTLALKGPFVEGSVMREVILNYWNWFAESSRASKT